MVKLEHVRSNARLHSHEVAYGTGSGQQSVTGFRGGGDPNSYWIVKGPHAKPMPKRGSVVKCGDLIRLEHVQTTRNLHSHQHRSPLSNNLEVSCYGSGESMGDTHDNWRVDCLDNEKIWSRGSNVYLFHEEVNGYLSSSPNFVFQQTIANQLEVHVARSKSLNSLWKTNEGVYFKDLSGSKV
mmetsp:Transcript_17696/g.36724  ORF Transcript_17696/g.36724 Transcript_17696/m.36724 type:complete len:182 (+) Transcript_17696:123-668(+)